LNTHITFLLKKGEGFCLLKDINFFVKNQYFMLQETAIYVKIARIEL